MEQPVSAALDGASQQVIRADFTQSRRPCAIQLVFGGAEAENDHMPPIKGEDFSEWNRVPPGVICAPTKGGSAAPQGCTTAAAARPVLAVSQGRL